MTKKQYQGASRRPHGRVTKSFKGVSMVTEQSHRETVKIQNILKKYRATGDPSMLNVKEGTYGDYTQAPDFVEAQQIIAEAKSAFDAIPAQIRRQFDNDPAKYLAFMQDPKNKEAIAELGLDASYLPDPVEPPPSLPKTQAELEDLITSKIASQAPQEPLSSSSNPPSD